MWSLVPNAGKKKKRIERRLRELDLTMERLHVILTGAVSREWIGQRSDCNDLGIIDDEKADYS